MRTLIVLFLALGTGWLCLANSFTVTWVLSPSFGTIYSWQTSWSWGPINLGIQAEVYGEAWLAQSPTLGIPLLYGVISDLRLQYTIGLTWENLTVTWGHVCYYRLQKDRWWDGQGLEWLRLNADF